ncbi:MAG: alanine racemase [Negativicutes bacterium]|nr:alanine racemase [Negativicutes bacterium]
MFERPVWAEINLAAIAHNVRRIRQYIKPSTKICAVIKADAYGHGTSAVVRTVMNAGADYLGVAILNEAIDLRREGFTIPILVLGYTPPRQAAQIVDNNVTQTVFNYDVAEAISNAAVAVGQKAKIHLKIDTGMNRIGIRPEDAGDFAEAVAKLPGIELEGVYSHFATADSQDKAYVLEQFGRFKEALAMIEAKGIQIPIKHIANSAATLDLPETHLDMVRPGIIMYGLWPSNEVDKKLDLKPAMKFKAKVSLVKDVPANASVSYGQNFYTQKASRIATLPVGYADGWLRQLSGKASVLIRGQRAPVVGSVCMDQCMVDVTNIPGVSQGDVALLFGGAELPAEEIADKLGTINYEVICLVGKRVPRHYVSE